VTRRQPWPWIVLFVWSAWLYAVLGRLSAGGLLGGFTPDLGLVLLLALQPRLPARDARRAALLVSLARAAFSAGPPLAIAAGMLAAVELSRALAEFVEIEGLLARGAVAGALALFCGTLLALVHAARLDPGLLGGGVPFPAGAILRAAVGTGLCAVAAGPLLGRLPGLSAFTHRERRAFA